MFKVTLYSDFDVPFVINYDESKGNLAELSKTLFDKSRIDVDLSKVSLLNSLFCSINSNPYLSGLEELLHTEEAKSILDLNTLMFKEIKGDHFDLFDTLEQVLLMILTFKTISPEEFEKRLNLGFSLYKPNAFVKEQLEVLPLIVDLDSLQVKFQSDYPTIYDSLKKDKFFENLDTYFSVMEPHYHITFSLEKLGGE